MTSPMAKLLAQTGQRVAALNQEIEAAEARRALAALPPAPAPAVTPDQLIPVAQSPDASVWPEPSASLHR
jgi:hypothetical protein